MKLGAADPGSCRTALPVRPLSADRVAAGPARSPRTCRGSGTTSCARPWSSNYTININTEMNYWPAEPANLPELTRAAARLHPGARRSTDARPSRPTTALAAGRRTTTAICGGTRRRSGTSAHGDPVWAFWPMAGAWLSQHLYEHYLFGGDLAFLRDRAYPVMKGAAEFCLDWLVDDGQGTSRDVAVHVAGAQVHHRRTAAAPRSRWRRRWTWRSSGICSST